MPAANPEVRPSISGLCGLYGLCGLQSLAGRRGITVKQQSGDRQGAVDHQRVVRASARVLAYRRWNRDDKGNSVFQQLLFPVSDEDEEHEAP